MLNNIPDGIRFTPEFRRNLRHLAKKYRHIRSDLQPILELIEVGQHPGDHIADLRVPVYKVRIPNTDARRGKRGGYRVVYALLTDMTTILLTIYSKSDQNDIAAHDIAALLRPQLDKMNEPPPEHAPEDAHTDP